MMSTLKAPYIDILFYVYVCKSNVWNFLSDVKNDLNCLTSAWREYHKIKRVIVRNPDAVDYWNLDSRSRLQIKESYTYDRTM